MAELKVESSQDKQITPIKQDRIWREDTWVFGALTAVSIFMLQVLLVVNQADTSVIVSLLAFAVALPMNALVVLLASAKIVLGKIIHNFFRLIAVTGTFIGINAAFWHTSWIVGLVYTASSIIALIIAIIYIPDRPKDN